MPYFKLTSRSYLKYAIYCDTVFCSHFQITIVSNTTIFYIYVTS